MPSFKEMIAVLTTFVVLSTAAGKGEWVWKSLVWFRLYTLQETKKDWGCPSIFNKNACNPSQQPR